MQVGYDVLMLDFFIEKNLPREEKIVSIIPDGMHLQYCYLVGFLNKLLLLFNMFAI
jgi:hypothetical protein